MQIRDFWHAEKPFKRKTPSVLTDQTQAAALILDAVKWLQVDGHEKIRSRSVTWEQFSGQILGRQQLFLGLNLALLVL